MKLNLGDLAQDLMVGLEEGPAVQAIIDPDVKGDPFEWEPVPLEVFLYDRDYLRLPQMGEEQANVVELATNVYPYYIREMLGWETPNFDIVTCLWGKGSGKDFISRVSILRSVYLLLCLKEPQACYGMVRTDHIDFINMAYSSYQARNIFFMPLIRLLRDSKFFRGMWAQHGNQIEFDKGLLAHSGNSSQESFEGFNPLLVVLDEIDAFRTRQDLRRYRGQNPEHSAEGIFNALKSSSTSRFPGIGKVMLLSFLRRPDGFMMQMYQRAQKDVKAYASKGATWEINPTKDRVDFEDDFRRNPEDSAMRYACIPTATRDHFFKNRDLLYEVFHYDPETDDVRVNAPMNPFSEGEFLTGYELSVNDHRPRYMHVDIGISNDAATVVSVHLHGWMQQFNVQMPVVKVDFIARLDPRDAVTGEIEIDQIREVIRKFRYRRGGNKLVNIAVVTFDQFQSRDSMQILSREGFVTGYRSVDKDDHDYVSTKELVYTKRLLSPGTAIVPRELRELIRIPGRVTKVDHVTGGSKDAADALCGAVGNMMDDLFQDLDHVIKYDERETIGQAYGTLPDSMPDGVLIGDPFQPY